MRLMLLLKRPKSGSSPLPPEENLTNKRALMCGPWWQPDLRLASPQKCKNTFLLFISPPSLWYFVQIRQPKQTTVAGQQSYSTQAHRPICLLLGCCYSLDFLNLQNQVSGLMGLLLQIQLSFGELVKNNIVPKKTTKAQTTEAFSSALTGGKEFYLWCSITHTQTPEQGMARSRHP